MSARVLIIVPTLNESAHIPSLLDGLLVEAEVLDATIVVADGGSQDGTREIVAARAAGSTRIHLINNTRRIQSAAINLAVALYGDRADYLIRIDAHGTYPTDYCRDLVAEAEERGVGSVVVPMTTMGHAPFQRAVATAQNSPIGTGGSAHRTGNVSGPVDHGHHALMRVDAFRQVGGYDETFRANEDAELDFRLRAAGHTIWLTDRTGMIYYPRATATGLFRQYFGYGGGRARNILKHRMRPRLRQMAPLAILPVVLLAVLSIWHWAFLVPLLLWGVLCIGLGVHAARKYYPEYDMPMSLSPLVGWAAMIMHFAWSSGFWLHLIQRPFRKGAA
ncbi:MULTISPECIES: glycosyltransferase family 2 protein [unclassified Devosia]|uniref:glycosyltransferase family 2 protein n=1 Tax=unclassified Devosia TaxID=196773 RepID=UPI000712AC4E|nr:MULTISPECIES: glycosyltransferase family 2 protein [unclassified Devosia]KQN69691.1 succinoglycan biosynthesis protein exoa [Devosia sp. Leaf64]KQT45807.1 succinoglycan biosynthesis protein exoa [Devosia sp. Leaf420]